MKELEKWRINHEGNIPLNFTENNQFRDNLKRSARFGFVEEENFQEALTKVGNAFKAPNQLPDIVISIFERLDSINFNDKTHQFWHLIRALKKFIESEGRAPVRYADYKL